MKNFKGYVCLFVCMATKAVHLELVSGLSTQDFIMAFKRFISTRGKCVEMFSDNGTNFRGAASELNRMFKSSSQFYNEVSEALPKLESTWTFIPPHAPHFGGLWEAGVKSVKYHLRRVIGDQKLTFEEFYTVLKQIEACLNSRPLYPVSEDPNDPLPLTPGHFLITEPLTAVAEPPVPDNKSLSKRYHLLQSLRDSFWQRWRLEYIHHLQQLRKWKKLQPDLKLKSIVLIKDEIEPPTEWKMGRIIELYRSTDEKVRSVKVHTSSGDYDRPIVKIIPLPVDTSNSDLIED